MSDFQLDSLKKGPLVVFHLSLRCQQFQREIFPLNFSHGFFQITVFHPIFHKKQRFEKKFKN